MAMASILTVHFDTSALDAAVARLCALSPQLAQPLLERVEAFVSAVETGEQALFVKRTDSPAVGAGDVTVFLDPSDGLLDLLAAVGAGNV